MGLLDIWGKGSESFKNRREDELAGRVQGIIGQVGESNGRGPMQAQGLLGDNLTPEQFSTQLGQQLMGVPGYQNNATNLINQMTANRQSDRNNMNTVQGANDRYMYGQNNISAAQRQSAGQSQYNSDQGYLYKEMDRAYKNEEIYRNNTEMAANTLSSMADENGVIDYKNTNGIQHNQLVLTLAKSILGNEAVMSDDRGAITLAGGAPGWLSSMVAKVNGGTLGEGDFYNVVEQLQNNIQTGMDRNQAMRDRTLGRIQSRGGNESWMPIATKPVNKYTLGGKGTTMGEGILNIPQEGVTGNPDNDPNLEWSPAPSDFK